MAERLKAQHWKCCLGVTLTRVRIPLSPFYSKAFGVFRIWLSQSKSTATRLSDYKAIAEFEEYVLIHQKQILVERFQRKSNNLWVPQIYREGETVELSSINFTCAIAMLYENLEMLSEA